MHAHTEVTHHASAHTNASQGQAQLLLENNEHLSVKSGADRKHTHTQTQTQIPRVKSDNTSIGEWYLLMKFRADGETKVVDLERLVWLSCRASSHAQHTRAMQTAFGLEKERFRGFFGN